MDISKQFKISFLGYNKSKVDSYLIKIVEEYEMKLKAKEKTIFGITKQNNELKENLKGYSDLEKLAMENDQIIKEKDTELMKLQSQLVGCQKTINDFSETKETIDTLKIKLFENETEINALKSQNYDIKSALDEMLVTSSDLNNEKSKIANVLLKAEVQTQLTIEEAKDKAQLMITEASDRSQLMIKEAEDLITQRTLSFQEVLNKEQEKHQAIKHEIKSLIQFSSNIINEFQKQLSDLVD